MWNDTRTTIYSREPMQWWERERQQGRRRVRRTYLEGHNISYDESRINSNSQKSRVRRESTWTWVLVGIAKFHTPLLASPLPVPGWIWNRKKTLRVNKKPANYTASSGRC
jgi:hypothetical protein